MPALDPIAPAASIALLRAFLPIAGVLWLGWDAAHVVGFWFLETIVVGVVNVPRIVLSRGEPDDDESPKDTTGCIAAPFFVVHYGFFVAVQTVLLLTLLGPDFDARAFLHHPDVLRDALACLTIEVADLVWRGIWLGERKLYSPLGQMFRPYLRIVTQQFTVLLGGWVAVLAGLWSPGDRSLGVLIALITIRTAFELAAPRWDIGFRTSQPAP